MAGPWERYAAPTQGSSPWERYAPAPVAPAAPPRSAIDQVLAVPTQAAAGINDRAADVLGAPVDLIGQGLRSIGVPVPEDAFGGSASIRRGIQSVTGAPAAPQNTVEEAARGAGRGVVDAAAFLAPAAGIARVAQAGGVASRAATQAMTLPGLQVGAAAAGGAVSEATNSPIAGVATALALPFGAAGAARLISPITNTLSPARAALVAAAEREGIPLSAGQATGSRTLQNMEGAMAQLPGTSGAEAAFGQSQHQAFNRAVLKRAGVDADNAGPEVLNEARSRIGGTIGSIAERNTLKIDDTLLERLAQQEDEISRFAVPEVSKPIRERMMQLVGQVDDAGEVPGSFYRQLDSALGRSMKGTANGDLRNAVGDLRNILREGMDASITGSDAEAFRDARRQYANLMVAAKAAGGAGGGAAEGNISPLALRGALDQSTGGGYAFGRGDLNELARIGQGVLRAPPDSGTAGRSFMNQLLTGSMPVGGAGAGAMIGGPAGAVVGSVAGLALPSMARAAYVNPLMQNYLRNQAIRPGVRQSITGLRNNLLSQQGVAQLND